MIDLFASLPWPLIWFFISLLGAAGGILTGIIPGIHVNNVTALLLVSTASLISLGIDLNLIIAFICALVISHTFFDVIPGLFLGVPGDESYALLPGHRLVKRGLGRRAINLSVGGSLFGLLMGLSLMLLFVFLNESRDINIIGILEKGIKDYMFWVLLGVSFILIVSETSPTWSLITFLTSGFFGVLVLGSPIIEGGDPAAALFPSLSGLFGIAGLIYALTTTKQNERNIKTKSEQTEYLSPSRKDLITPSVRGGIGGMIVGMLPGLGSANAATLLLLIERKLSRKTNNDDQSNESYLVTTSSLNTTDAFFAVVALYLIGKSRSGASVAIDQMLAGEMLLSHLPSMGAAMLVGGMMSCVIMWKFSRFFVEKVGKIDEWAINGSVIIFLFVLVFALQGIGGLTILGFATVIGLLPLVAKVRRSQLMGFFLMPTMLFFSGYQTWFVDTLSLQAKTGFSSLIPSLSQIILYFGIASSFAVVAYVGMKLIKTKLLRHTKKIILISASLWAAVIVAGFLYPNDDPTFEYSLIDAELVETIDGDTVKLTINNELIKVRLSYIDAPELKQPYGEKSRDHLNTLLNEKKIRIREDGVDRYSRSLQTLFVGQENINERMVSDGFAWVYKYNRKNETLINFEKQAKDNNLGLWNRNESRPIPPWVWRKSNKPKK